VNVGLIDVRENSITKRHTDIKVNCDIQNTPKLSVKTSLGHFRRTFYILYTGSFTNL